MVDKATQIMKLFSDELLKIASCADRDREYTPLGGNGCNAVEAYEVLYPLMKRAKEIYFAATEEKSGW